MIKLPPKGIFSSPRGHVATVNENISLKSPLFTAEESDVANYNILKTPERNVNSVARYTKREVSVINSASKTSKTPGNTRQVSNSMERSRNEKHDSTKKKKVFTGLGVIYSPNEDTKIAYTRTHMVPREILEGEIIAKLEILKSLQEKKIKLKKDAIEIAKILQNQEIAMNEEKEKITENYTKIKAAIEKEKEKQKQHQQKFEETKKLAEQAYNEKLKRQQDFVEKYSDSKAKSAEHNVAEESSRSVVVVVATTKHDSGTQTDSLESHEESNKVKLNSKPLKEETESLNNKKTEVSATSITSSNKIDPTRSPTTSSHSLSRLFDSNRVDEEKVQQLSPPSTTSSHSLLRLFDGNNDDEGVLPPPKMTDAISILARKNENTVVTATKSPTKSVQFGDITEYDRNIDDNEQLLATTSLDSNTLTTLKSVRNPVNNPLVSEKSGRSPRDSVMKLADFPDRRDSIVLSKVMEFEQIIEGIEKQVESGKVTRRSSIASDSTSGAKLSSNSVKEEDFDDIIDPNSARIRDSILLQKSRGFESKEQNETNNVIEKNEGEKSDHQRPSIPLPPAPTLLVQVDQSPKTASAEQIEQRVSIPPPPPPPPTLLVQVDQSPKTASAEQIEQRVSIQPPPPPALTLLAQVDQSPKTASAEQSEQRVSIQPPPPPAPALVQVNPSPKVTFLDQSEQRVSIQPPPPSAPALVQVDQSPKLAVPPPPSAPGLVQVDQSPKLAVPPPPSAPGLVQVDQSPKLAVPPPPPAPTLAQVDQSPKLAVPPPPPAPTLAQVDQSPKVTFLDQSEQLKPPPPPPPPSAQIVTNSNVISDHALKTISAHQSEQISTEPSSIPPLSSFPVSDTKKTASLNQNTKSNNSQDSQPTNFISLLSNIKLRKVTPKSDSAGTNNNSNTPSWLKNRRPTYVPVQGNVIVDINEKERKAREETERKEKERKAREETERAIKERKAREEAERKEKERKAIMELNNNAPEDDLLPPPLTVHSSSDHSGLVDNALLPDSSANTNDTRIQNQADLVADVLQLRNAVRRSFKKSEPIDMTTTSMPSEDENNISAHLQPEAADVEEPVVPSLGRVKSMKRKQALNMTQVSSLLLNVDVDNLDVSNNDYFDDEADVDNSNSISLTSSKSVPLKAPQVRTNKNYFMETVPEEDEDEDDDDDGGSFVPQFLGHADKIRSFREALQHDREQVEDRSSTVRSDETTQMGSRISDTTYTMSMDEELELKQKEFKSQVRPTFVNNFRYFEQKVNEVGSTAAPMPIAATSAPSRNNRRRSKI